MNKIPFQSLGEQWKSISGEALPLIDKILSSGKYLEHEIVLEIENELSRLVGVRKVLLVNSGTDALMLSLKGLEIGKGDEVITVPNSFVASAAAVEHVGAKCVFVDTGKDHLIDPNAIEQAISAKTKAIMPVHLEGKVCKMDQIMEIAKKHNLVIIEDAAQSIGSTYKSLPAGSFGEAACFSLHPLKNLNACGDGGFIASNNSSLIEKINAYRNHGQIVRNESIEFGVVSRFDSLQAAVLKVRMKNLDSNIKRRRFNAELYFGALNSKYVKLPIVDKETYHSYHLFVVEVEKRTKLMSHLQKLGIETKIHYPNLITEQQAYITKYRNNLSFKNAQYQKDRILSLPIHEFMKKDEILYVSETINNFFRNESNNE